jgi:hypothetical protein
MKWWGKVSVASVIAVALVTVTLTARHRSPGSEGSDPLGANVVTPGGRATPTPATPLASAVRPTPGSTPGGSSPSPIAHAPVGPHYDDGDFKDPDPKPATYELRAWALMNRQTGQITGSKNSATAHNSTESMIKAWIASDYFRRLGGSKPSATRLAQIRGMIRDSNDQDAQAVWAADGRDAVVERMIKVCGLKNTTIWHEWWSRTQITAQDAVRMGNCIASGKAAGPKWTGYLLNEMRHVRGEGRFGIVKALPASQQKNLAIKNGWTAISWDHAQWHVNCLGITDSWIMVVQVKYPIRLGLTYGAGYCQSQAAKILNGA